jgi:DNA-binding GntR family transcriptional regulator
MMKIRSVDISQTASASSVIFDALRRAIIEGQLGVGQPLRQEEIARQFNASRIPVREALMRLEELGLVRTQRYKGAVVSGLAAEEAVEIFDFRTLIEPALIRRAVPSITPEDLGRARGFCLTFAASTNPMEWGDLNRAFHTSLYQSSGMTYHLEALDNALDRIDRYLRAQLVLSDGMSLAAREHMAILQACESGDAELAAELTERHIIDARASFLEHLPALNVGGGTLG